MFQHRDILFRRAFVGFGQTVRSILDVKTDDCCCEIQCGHFGHVLLCIGLFVRGPNFGDLDVRKPKGLDGIQVKAISVFLQAFCNKISLGDIDKAFFPVAVDPAIKISSELIQLLHFKYPYKFFLRLRDQCFRRSCNYNVVDIKIKKYSFIFIDKTTDVGNECFKAVFPQYKDNDIVPLFRGIV